MLYLFVRLYTFVAMHPFRNVAMLLLPASSIIECIEHRCVQHITFECSLRIVHMCTTREEKNRKTRTEFNKRTQMRMRKAIEWTKRNEKSEQAMENKIK